MEKAELIKAISKRVNINPEQEEWAFDQAIFELVLPQIFHKTNGRGGFINNNSCTNNCADELFAARLRTLG